MHRREEDLMPMAANPDSSLYKAARVTGCTLCDDDGDGVDGGYFPCPHPEWAQDYNNPWILLERPDA